MIRNHRRLILSALSRLDGKRIEWIVHFIHVVGGARNRRQPGRRRRGPAEIPPADLHGVSIRTALILARVAVVAAQTVDLQLAGDVLTHDLVEIVGLSGSTARHLPAEDLRELVVAQAELCRFVSPRPGTVRQRDLRARASIDIEPRLARPAVLNVRIDRVEVPASCDDPVAVTLAAGMLRGERQEHLFGRIDVRIDHDSFFAFFARPGQQFDAVNGMCPAAVAFVAQKLLLGLARSGDKTRRQQT